ncbi:acyltransferase [Acinetobacter sp. YH12058]|uniref:acyltransferase n=1 Tax=Acinetobacter sp. YH12058 TaxID=2601058 RepID=UPI0015D28CEE|nr:acyltransferase [Acinetobacter sp. YH12058]
MKLIINVEKSYSDEFGNKVIVSDSTKLENIKVEFRGNNNLLVIDDKNKILKNINFEFSSNDGKAYIGHVEGALQARGNIRVGYKSLVVIGDKVTCTKPFFICASEATKILIGDDCMFATDNHIRTDDAHAIYDVKTGLRLNPSKDIIIGAHVWVAYAAKIYGGAKVGSGSIIGTNSIVKSSYPNNCTIVGAPSKCVRRNIAWERPNVARHKPWLRVNSDHIKKDPNLWKVTDDYNKEIYLGVSYSKKIDILSSSNS